jgi:GRF zinc finger/Zinc knuckle
MNMISRGEKGRQTVVDEMVAIYRDAFQTVFENSDVIIDTCKEFYTPAVGGVARREEREMGEVVRACMDCGADMHLRSVDSGFVVSCAAYPTCTLSKWVPSMFYNVTVDESCCERCTDQVHNLRVEFDVELDQMTSPGLICLWCDKFQGPECNCRTPSDLRKSTKPGPNCGRLFYTCSSKSCQYFKWKDEVTETDGPDCGCGTPSLMLKTVKEGPNQGRFFYTCPTKTCGFFQWRDQDDSSFAGPSTAYQQNSYPPPSSSYQSNNQSYGNNGDRRKCDCDLVAAFKTDKNGRDYYKCPKAGKTCKFFAWADGIGNNSGSGNGSSNSSAVCFKCNQPGHFSNSCPNGGPSQSSNTTSVCFKCNQPGHFSNSCPNGGSGGPSSGSKRGGGSKRGRGGSKRGASKAKSKIGKQQSMRL